VVILGGGIAGLTAAYRLRQKVSSPEALAITLVETKRGLGGSLGTDHVDGFVLERGADSFLTAKPAGVALARELGLESHLQGMTGRKVYVLRGGVLHALPEGLVLIATPRILSLLGSSLLSMRGKLRMALDLAIPRREGGGDESVAAFVRRRLGQEALDRIAEPLMAGIYAGDPGRLSMRSLLPQFLEYEREHGSVLRGLRAMNQLPRTNEGGIPRPFASFLGGMGELVEALVRRTPGITWRTGTRALEVVQTRDDAFEIPLDDGTYVVADSVLLATQAPIAAELTAGLDARLAQALRAIPYTSSAVVSLAFPATSCAVLEGSGFVVPRNEGLRLKACTFASAKFVGRAPRGHVLLRAFYGGAGGEDILRRGDADLIDLALEELRGPLGLRGPPELARVYRWPLAHPQYEVGHFARVAAIEAAHREVRGLFLAGSAYRGIGIPDCMEDASRAAEDVLAFLRSEAMASREVPS